MSKINTPNLSINLKDITKELFQKFKNDVHDYFIASSYDVESKEMQVDILKNLMGPDLIELYTLLSDTKNNIEDINYVFTLLENYFNDKSENFILHKFVSKKQENCETLYQYYLNLENLINFCDFGDQKNKVLKAQILAGIKNETCRKKIIEENLSLEEIVSYFKNYEVHEGAVEENGSDEDVQKISTEPDIDSITNSDPNCTLTFENSKDFLEPDVVIKEEIDPDDENFIDYSGTNNLEKLKNEEGTEIIDVNNLKNENFDCNICSKSFKNESNLNKHNSRKHGIKRERVLKKATCPICKKIYSSLSAMKNHQKIHLGKKDYVCEICSKAFIQNYDLQLHLRRHKGDRDKECEICHYKFYRNSELMNHIKGAHSDERRICCEICGIQLKTRNHLTYHMRVHTGERPYKCDLCPKSFSLLTSMKNHRLIHTGEKNHVCEICSRAFTEKGQLRKHMRTHRDRANATISPKFNKRNFLYTVPESIK